MSARSLCLSQFGGLAAGQADEQKRYFREKRLYTLQIESTNVCMQGCVYCYAGSTPTDTSGLDSPEIRALLHDAAGLGVRAIDWLGGDPLERPDWHELLTEARSLGLINNVWTSGLPLRNQDVARKVADATEGGFVSVHVDSVFPETYARLHRNGSAKRIADIIAGVDNMLAAGKPRDELFNCITYTSLQPPWDAIETMRWWLKEKGMRTCLTLFNPSGPGADRRSLEPGPEEVRLVFRERDRLNYGDAEPSISTMDVDKFYCGTMATVTFAGDVTPCSVIREGVGNIRVTPFDRIVAEHLGVLIHAPLHDERSMPAPCDSCRHNAHCWGCRANAYHSGGDANALDPKCWIIREIRSSAS